MIDARIDHAILQKSKLMTINSGIKKYSSPLANRMHPKTFRVAGPLTKLGTIPLLHIKVTIEE
jgi:hypothetical protein